MNAWALFSLKRLSTERRILTLIVTIIMVLLVIAGAVIDRGMDAESAQQRVADDVQRIVRLDNVLLDLVDAETGERGFVISGSPRFLEPYNVGVSRLSHALHLLSVSPRSASVATLDQLQRLVASKVSTLRHTIAVRRLDGFAAAAQLVNTARGKHQMDLVRSEIDRIKQVFVRDAMAQRVQAKTQVAQTAVWMAVGAVIFVLFLSFAYYQILKDLREKRSLTARLQHQANHDVLTGLANRRYFTDYLQYALRAAERDGEKLALLYIDLDGFKAVNDSLGHEQGDEALKIVARVLDGAKRDVDLLARLGGDEFAVLVPGLASETEVIVLAQRLLDAFAHPDIKLVSYSLGASIGVSFYPADAVRWGQLMQTADEAMYRAKAAGGGQVAFYHAPWTDELTLSQRLRNDLTAAFEQDQFMLCYQPVVAAFSTEVVGVEALVRWRHPELGVLYPDEFLPILQQSGMSPRLTQTVVRKGVRQLKAWDDQGGDLTLAINLSAQDCASGAALLAALEEELHDAGLAPSRVEVELTESSLMLADAELLSLQLVEYGVRLAIDDFGTGYASLSYLRRFPVHRVKIDRSFVAFVPEDPYNVQLVSAIIAMAKRLDLQVTAEGVETQAQADFLREQGCDLLQGYLFGRPEEPSSCFVRPS